MLRSALIYLSNFSNKPAERLKLVDVVSVNCNPNKFHADLSIEALNHGVHVLCEKPMAMTTEECDPHD